MTSKNIRQSTVSGLTLVQANTLLIQYIKAVKLSVTSVSVSKDTVSEGPAGIRTRGLLLIRQACYQLGHPTGICLIFNTIKPKYFIV